MTETAYYLNILPFYNNRFAPGTGTQLEPIFPSLPCSQLWTHDWTLVNKIEVVYTSLGEFLEGMSCLPFPFFFPPSLVELYFELIEKLDMTCQLQNGP